MRLDLYSHHFTVTKLDEQQEQIVREYCRRFVEIDTIKKPDGTVESKPTRVWVERINHRRLSKVVYHFHIESYDDFKRYLAALPTKYQPRIKEVVHSLYIPKDVQFPINPKFKPFDYQEPLIENITSEGYKKVITLQTGKGKTAVFLFSIVEMGKRVLMVIPPKYFDRWITDLSVNYNKEAMIPLRDGIDLMTIQGSDQLRSAVMLAKADEFTPKFVLLSAQTFFAFLKDYKEHGIQEKYANITPTQLWELWDIGVIGVDEGHENMYGNYRLDLHTHAPKTVTLSATITPDDPFLRTMSEILYPPRLRQDGGAYDKYVDLVNVPYILGENGHLLKTTWRGRTDYSQLAFEASLLTRSNKQRLKHVFEMIEYDIEDLFLKLRKPDHRLLIFFDSVEMCTVFAEHLQKKYPYLQVGRYTAEEDYDVLNQLDIIVATTKSADTGVDIRNLQMVFCFVARGSTTSNLQMVGRLRKLKDDSITPMFIYYTCTDIKQHVNYHEKRKEMFSGRALTHTTRQTNFVI